MTGPVRFPYQLGLSGSHALLMALLHSYEQTETVHLMFLSFDPQDFRSLVRLKMYPVSCWQSSFMSHLNQSRFLLSEQAVTQEAVR